MVLSIITYRVFFLEITVIAIVLLVIAAVLIGIFVTGVNNVNPYTDARANCINTGFSVCKSMEIYAAHVVDTDIYLQWPAADMPADNRIQ